MNLFELFARLLEFLVVWVPRPVYVPKTDAVGRWTFGRDVTVFTGKLIWYVPLFQQMERVDLRADAMEFEPKVLWTKDGKEAAIGMTVVYRVADPTKCFTTVNGLSMLMARVGESVLPELVGSFTLDELKRKASGGEGREWGFDVHLRRALNTTFADYGISVDRARLNFTSDRVRTFKIIGGSGADTSSIVLG